MRGRVIRIKGFYLPEFNGGADMQGIGLSITQGTWTSRDQTANPFNNGQPTLLPERHSRVSTKPHPKPHCITLFKCFIDKRSLYICPSDQSTACCFSTINLKLNKYIIFPEVRITV